MFRSKIPAFNPVNNAGNEIIMYVYGAGEHKNNCFSTSDYISSTYNIIEKDLLFVSNFVAVMTVTDRACLVRG